MSAEDKRSRRHLAKKLYGADGARIYCHGCDWVATVGGSDRVQREQHRQHRRDEGEEVAGSLRLEHHERIKLIRLLHTPREDNLRINEEGQVTRGLVCPACRVPAPCVSFRLADGDAEAEELVLRLREGYDG